MHAEATPAAVVTEAPLRAVAHRGHETQPPAPAPVPEYQTEPVGHWRKAARVWPPKLVSSGKSVLAASCSEMEVENQYEGSGA